MSKARLMDHQYSKLDLEVITSDELESIEANASMLNLIECMEYICVDYTELPQTEQSFCELAWKRGRAMGLRKASDKMFAHMATRAGGTTAIEYLRSMSGDFQIDATPSPGSNSGFSFNVNMASPGMQPAKPISEPKGTKLEEAS